ncbi:MAG: hypothetical protein UY07_C0032G0005 [Parcubacteria group bacterium GW2011_GWA1_47_8]|nr:MAG: hypothetical protein UY07_C0032G0005 [Parcubacteria group bacterium GW2011_GWA1_47_8]KKW07995.1 MAG: hypothetical protein UY42_C0002G0044 [Parcubacteria group bacterium GW2011_GWA2_49_16]
MDSKKDIQGQSPTRTQGNSAFPPATTGGIESFGLSIAKKCERIATALYLVTNFLSDTEPLKARLRLLGLELVRDASSVRYGTMLEAQAFGTLHATIAETLSLLELAFIAGLVSEMNFSILRREYLAVRDSSEVKKASRESRTDSILGDNFFGSSEPRSDLGYSRGQTLVSSTIAAQPFPKGHSIGQTSITMSDRNTKGRTPSPHRSLRGGTTKQSSTQHPAPIQNSKFDISYSTQIESRRTKILKLIKDNREVTIKDISSHFSELSEKTIQRELVALVEGGVLKKEGERRWSRYTLA